MRRIAVLFIVLSALANGMAFGQKRHYLPEDSAFVVGLLDRASHLPDSANLQLFFAREFIGRPYVAHTLEVFDDERLVVNTRELDCTTLVESVTALTLCAMWGKSSFADYMDILTSLRYRGGVMGDYTTRLHYFTDWIVDKTEMGIVTEIQSPVPPFTAVQRINVYYMTAHPGSYKALAANPKFVPVIKEQERRLTGRTYRYIPKSAVNNTALLRRTIKDGDIIAITCNKKGLDIAHLGFAVWRKDGLHLLNASMIHHKVVEEPMTLYQYLQKHPSHTGIRIVRINEIE